MEAAGIFVPVLILVILLRLLYVEAKLAIWNFYRTYFFTKQWNIGKDPEQVIRLEFPQRILRWLLLK